MSSCSGNCSTCGSDCADRKAESLLATPNPKSSIKKVIAVVSGKGGVGKSTVTSMLAVAMARKGKRVGVLDADITGPSAPTAFGVTECANNCCFSAELLIANCTVNYCIVGAVCVTICCYFVFSHCFAFSVTERINIYSSSAEFCITYCTVNYCVV